MTCASLACARPPPGVPDRVFHASRPSRGVVSCVALGLPGHPPKGVVPRYPPRGILCDCSRPVPGSCRGVVSPLSGGFPHSVHGGIPAWGILSGACWARRDDPRYVGQQRLAERLQRRIQVRHREGRHRIVLLIGQSRPSTVTSREKGIGPQWDPSFLLVHEIRQRWRRSEGDP